VPLLLHHLVDPRLLWASLPHFKNKKQHARNQTDCLSFMIVIADALLVGAIGRKWTI
jgi:hypothetical protein